MSTSTVQMTDLRTGETLTPLQMHTGVLFKEFKNPLYIKVTEKGMDGQWNQVFHMTIMFNHNIRKDLNLHKAQFHFRIWTTLKSTSASGIRDRLLYNIMYLLDSLGVISLSNFMYISQQ
ncbi:hypothetical protein U1Q18_034815 [Sarracenia purpurea var. burkii]